MADLGWFADTWARGSIDYYATLARGISPQQLVERLAPRPVQHLPDMTLREADAHIDYTSVYTVGRLAVTGGWSLLVESGASDGMFTPPDVSREGAEVLVFDPRQDDPPSYFTYLKDGELLLQLPVGEESDRSGTEPDVLLAAMLAADVIPQRELTEEELHAPPVERRLRTAHMLVKHFSLDLPKETIEDASLPAMLIRTTPPTSW